MDNETHYLSYDPDAIWREMMLAYVNEGGDPLKDGDEKQMLLQAVMQIILQSFAGIDNALRMDSLRYAVRDYLDIYGEKRACYRIEATWAEGTVSVDMSATGNAGTIPAGTAFTADGTVIYESIADAAYTGGAETLIIPVRCKQAGSVGNSLYQGAQMQCLTAIDGGGQIVCVTAATGGRDRESDENYRERIREWGLASVTTGPAQQYEAAAMAVSSGILDAKAEKGGDGEVNVYILPEDPTETTALVAAVQAALSDITTRPLTDQVTVSAATPVTYTLNVSYTLDDGTTNADALQSAAEEYKAWQEETIGRAFNPDKLMAMLYQAGAVRVVWASGSEFDGGTVEYTEIDSDEYCSGTITLSPLT